MLKRVRYILAALIMASSAAFGISGVAFASFSGASSVVDISTTGGNPDARSGDAFGAPQGYPAVSGDGRYIAFQSAATNLVANSVNGQPQVYVRDLQTSTTQLVSISMNGNGGNNYSQNPRISNDGRYVVFESKANDLVNGDTNNKSDIFRRDLVTGTTIRVNLSSVDSQGDDQSFNPDISANGDRIIFASFATNLVTGVTIGSSFSGGDGVGFTGGGIYSKDISTGAVRLVSSAPGSYELPNYTTTSARISCDGQTVVFASAANNIVPGDSNTYDPTTQAPRARVYIADLSQSSSGPMYINPNTNGQLARPTISCDGSTIAFVSSESNLVPIDTNGGYNDVFVYTRSTGVTEIVSLNSDGNQPSAPVSSDLPTISSDGNLVAFSGPAGMTNAPGWFGTGQQIYVRDRQHGTTELISHDANGFPSTIGSGGQEISSDGQTVAYQSRADNLVPGLGASYGLTYVAKSDKLSAPSNLSAASPTNQPNLSWNAVSGASSYNIYRDGTQIGNTTSTSYLDATAADGAHQYYVTASSVSNVEGNQSTQVTVLIDKTAPVLATPAWTSNPKITTGTTTLTVPATDTGAGIQRAEYFIGDIDPGQGNGATMTLSGQSGDSSRNLTTNFGTDFVPGVYKISVRAQDVAGNWSAVTPSFLTVWDPTGPTDIAASSKFAPSVSGGDVLPGLLADGQKDKADLGFDVFFTSTGTADQLSRLSLHYETGKNCKGSSPNNCHVTNFTVDTMAPNILDWFSIINSGSVGIFQGQGTLAVDGVTTHNPFKVVATDGNNTVPASSDSAALYIYAPGADPSTAAPVYSAHPTGTGNWVKVQ